MIRAVRGQSESKVLLACAVRDVNPSLNMRENEGLSVALSCVSCQFLVRV